MKKDQKEKAARFFDTSDDYERPYELGKTRPDKPRVGRPRTGKRSNADYVQISAYIKRETHRAAKKILIDDERDLSQLIEELLSAWVKKH